MDDSSPDAKTPPGLLAQVAPLAPTMLTIVGIWFLASGVAPDITGLNRARELLGGDGGIARAGVGFLFLYVGTLAARTRTTRRILDAMMGVIKSHLGSRSADR